MKKQLQTKNSGSNWMSVSFLVEFLDGWLNDLWANDHAPGTIRRYKSAVMYFLSWSGSLPNGKEDACYMRKGNVFSSMSRGDSHVTCALCQNGRDPDEAAKRAGLQISQSTAYRLRQRMRKAGEQALREGRHGPPIKLRGEVRKFVEETCRQAPHRPSHEIQTQLAQRFSLTVSVSQINRVRA